MYNSLPYIAYVVENKIENFNETVFVLSFWFCFSVRCGFN